MPVKIFFCYAREDEELLNELKMHLRPLQLQGLIDVWYDRDISAGSEWKPEIDKHLNSADIILLLVSPDFMNSDYANGVEVKRALERHNRGEARVIPVILRRVYWQIAPFARLQALPTDAEPVTSSKWHNQAEAFYNVAEGIRKVIAPILPPKKTAEIAPSVSTSFTHKQVNKRPLSFSSSRTLVLIALVFIVVLGGIIGYSVTHIPQMNRPNSTGTAGIGNNTPTTATAIAANNLYIQSTNGATVINDPLNNHVHNPWSLQNDPGHTCTFTSQNYHITVAQQGFTICFAEGLILTDYTFQVQLTILKGERGGLIFRVTPSKKSVDAYYFQINTAGRYSLFRVQNNTAYILLSGNSPLIKTGLNQPNTLTAIGRGSSISIFINKQYVGTATDTTYKSGIIGLIAQTLQQPTEVAFTNAEVWTVQ